MNTFARWRAHEAERALGVIRRGDEWGFRSAKLVRLGDSLIDADLSEELVETVEHVDAPARTAALHIPGTNTFLADGVWVHNDSVIGLTSRPIQQRG